jgi:quercetin dioxygenase-like cupin family protein
MSEQSAEVGRLSEVSGAEVPGLEGVTKQIVFGPGKNWEDYVLRCFTLEGDSRVPLHDHQWPHYVITLKGQARLDIDGESQDLGPLSFAFVPPNSRHGFVKTSQEPFVFLCIVPREGDVPPKE